MFVKVWSTLLGVNCQGFLRQFCGVIVVALVACDGGRNQAESARNDVSAAVCGTETLRLVYDYTPDQTKTYAYLPFTVAAGVRRIELTYGWADRSLLPSTPLNATTVDLGLWDERGVKAGFRGWGGSRQGREDGDTGAVFVEAQSADRGFEPGPINPGIWHVELGLAATGDAGADVHVDVRCLTEASGDVKGPGALLDPTYVARDEAGWYAADFHIHGYHSNPNAPDYEGVVAQAREAGLDILALTDYVTARHHRQLRSTQENNPDLLLWPGREIITYFGHANVHGEVPGIPEYRHGFDGISLGMMQAHAKSNGALFQINHPTIFPPPVFSNLCRGCAFELDDAVDFAQVDMIEVVTGPPLVSGNDIGAPIPGEIENPFITTAINYWLDKLEAGHKITAVSGSDSKGVDAPEERARKGYGSSATMVYATALSRPALIRSLQEGNAYVRVRGVHDSPEAELEVVANNGSTGTFGSPIDADAARLNIHLLGASGQLLTVFNSKLPLLTVPVTSDDFHFELPVQRNPLTEGPLGTIWRFEVRDARSRTIISNPVFLRGS